MTKVTKTAETSDESLGMVSKKIKVSRAQYEAMRSANMDLSNFEIHDPMEAARTKKLETIKDQAKAYVSTLVEFADIFDPITAMYKLKRIAADAVYGHYNSRKIGEAMSIKLDMDSGGDSRPTGLEIDEVGSSLDQIESTFARADKEHVLYEACILAQNHIYKAHRSDPALEDRWSGAAIDKSINEQGFADFCETQDNRYRSRIREQQAHSKAASQLDYTTRSFS